MHKWLKDHGVEFRNKSFCSAVLTDKDGVVRGVEVEGQYDFDKKTHKNTYKVQAVKGVVFATAAGVLTMNSFPLQLRSTPHSKVPARRAPHLNPSVCSSDLARCPSF